MTDDDRFTEDGDGLVWTLPDGTVVTDETLLAAAGPPQVDSTTGEPHTGAMLALVPNQPQAWTIDGGEPADQVHLTLAYLGDAADIPPASLQAIRDAAARVAGTTDPAEGDVFGVNLWNLAGDTPSLNWAVGGPRLAELHDRVWGEVVGAGTEADGWVPPPNHRPWVAHICAMYGDADTLTAAVPAAQALAGPVVFDTLRLAVGSEAHDFPLGAVIPPPVDPSGSMSSGGQILADNSVALVTGTQEASDMPWTIRPGGPDCPYEVVKEGTDQRAGCHDTEEAAQQQVEALYANEDDAAAVAAPAALPGEHLRAKMHTQGAPTGANGTGRVLTNTTYRDTPFAFHWSKASSAHQGQPVVVHVGNIVRVVPASAPGQPDWGFGTLDLGSDDGREYARRLVAGFERWGSIGLDETKPTVTLSFPENDDDDGDDDGLMAMFEEPDLVTIDGGRVMELTGVSTPAQADADIEPTDELIRAMLGDDQPTEQEAPVPEPAAAAVAVTHEPPPPDVTLADTVQALTAAAYTITIPELPPAWWFSEPTDVDMGEAAFNLTPDGRLYAVLAPLGVNHRAYARAGRRQEAPTGRVDYSRFMGGWALTADGRVPAGPVTMDCGHAARYRPDGDTAPAHYDNACTVVAKVAVGENRRRGYVWAAGALEPGVTVDQVSRMLACRLSGDWQPHSDKPGWSDFVAALLVPSPGFPMAHGGAQAEYEGDALVASSVPVRAVGPTGRPALRVNLSTGTVRRVGSMTPAEQVAAIRSDLAAGRPVRKGGCC